jgi:hypothetical protein
VSGVTEYSSEWGVRERRGQRMRMEEDEERAGCDVITNRTILVDLFWKVKNIWEATGVMNT